MTKIKVLVVEPDSTTGTVRAIEQSLESFQSLVGGPIEGLTLTEEVSAYINEEGKLVGLAVNVYGDVMIRELLSESGRRLLPGDVIVGPVVFVGAPDEEGWDTDLPEEFLAYARELIEINEQKEQK
jgi:hypothetical protein